MTTRNSIKLEDLRANELRAENQRKLSESLEAHRWIDDDDDDDNDDDEDKDDKDDDDCDCEGGDVPRRGSAKRGFEAGG